MKEYIEITEKDGTKKNVEVVFRLHDEENNTFYLVYKHNNNFYAAKYDDVIGTSGLNTDFNDEELKVLETLLNKIPEE